jgi:hypothetical protein
LHSYANAGTIGLGEESPIWYIQNDGAQFDVNMANYNNWTFADPDWTATYNTSTLGLGTGDYDYYSSIYADGVYFIGETNLIGETDYVIMTAFGFGKYYSNGTAYYVDLMNSNTTQYGDYANMSVMTANFEGLGLPSPLFYEFATLLSYAT